MRALDANTMVILPTGLGKTAVALLVAASRLYNEGGRVLMLAPTKPLVEQHLRFFERYLLVKADRVRMFRPLSCSPVKPLRPSALKTGTGQR